MNEKPTIKFLERGAKFEGRVVPSYPEDPREIETSYSNFVAVLTSAKDVFLDFSQIQPQMTGQDEATKQQTVAATIVHRVVVTPETALEMARLLIQTLQTGNESPARKEPGQ